MRPSKGEKRDPSPTPATTPSSQPTAPPVDEWALPALVGVQARSMFYVVMVKLGDLSRLFTPADGKASPSRRAQRLLTKARVRKIVGYVLGNPTTYTFSALAGAIDALPRFVPAGEGARIGTLCFPHGTVVSLLDGQHRFTSIVQAVREDRAKKGGGDLAYESIAVVLFVDTGLERNQQRFADLNRYAVRPSGSLTLLYDHRDELADVARTVAREVPVFAGLTDLEKTACAEGSPMLFTLGAIHAATRELLGGTTMSPIEARALALAFWSEVAGEMRDWRAVVDGQAKAPELRRTFVHAHAVALQAIGRVGRALVRERPDTWQEGLHALGTVNWLRSNAGLWEGRALVGGRMSKSAASVVLTANALKLHLGLDLGPEEMRLEEAHTRDRSAPLVAA
jgi:DNA sulfur modification protein DndB